ncbi:aminotransferase class I/II-fold pyridoxal phosphate-dependent enzyme [Natrarchaeobius sp. A-rgal3]|uniref:aminotransferase class I/II-fold pyridoxal phosphate-dependent enzyme n=1 Tax=Natrarchaeobius versutus TaxID=1679078 RepID=UPI00350EA9F5
MSGHGFDLGTRLEDRRSRELYRELRPADRVGEYARFAPDPGARVPTLEESGTLVFASNDYLGLAGDGRLVDAAREAAASVGVGAGASRLVTGDTVTHRSLERTLADAKGTERALTFSSGYAANVGTITALSPDVVFSDALNHASVVDGCRLSDAEIVVYDHRDVDDLAATLCKRREREATSAESDEESWLIVTDSVFSMDGTVAPLEALCELAGRYGAWVMVDEAHATGLYDDGGGIVQREGLEDRVHVQLGTLSKALGSQGGYVAGSAELVEHLVNAARSFVFSTGLAPPAAAAAEEAVRITRDSTRRDRLHENAARLRAGLTDLGYELGGSTQILPVMIGDRERALELAERVRSGGIVAPAIRPPTVPEGTSRIRIAPSAGHDRDDVDACLAAFAEAGRDLGVIYP